MKRAEKDCSSCCQYDQANETCTASDLLECDPEEFDKVCPKINGDPEYQDDFDD